VIQIKAQYSLEVILVFAFCIAIIIPILSLARSEYMKNREIIDQSQAKQVLDQIALAAQTVHYGGFPTKTTLDVYFPKGLSEVSSNSIQTPPGSGIYKSEIFFKFIDSGTEITSPTLQFEIRLGTDYSPTLSTAEGKRKIIVRSDREKISHGNYKYFVRIQDFNG
jgi:hypothetical protein